MKIRESHAVSIWPRLGKALLDVLYPPTCVACGNNADWLCQTCVRSISPIAPPFCRWCGVPGDDAGCRDCRSEPLRLERIRAAGIFEGALQTAVHALKYQGLTAVAPMLGHLMAKTWSSYGEDIDLIVPIPLHARRARTRGYNQSAVLAKYVGQHLSAPVSTSVLRRVRATRDQIGLTRSERKSNVGDAFGIDVKNNVGYGGEVLGLRILLIDDVCTTGYTLDAGAVALLGAGASSVSALVAARRVEAAAGQTTA